MLATLNKLYNYILYRKEVIEMFLNEDLDLNVFDSGCETKIGNQIITEAIIQDALLESNQTILDEDSMLSLLSEELLSERNILKWDKYAKRKHATNKAEIVLARENNDRDYKKLVTVYKLRAKLLARIHQKYGNKAKIRVRQQMSNKGVSKVVGNIAKKSNVSLKATDMRRK